MSPIKHILARVRRRSLILRSAGVKLYFSSPDEFVRYLSDRLTVTADSMEHFSHMDQRSLSKEARKLLHASQNVIDIMANSKQSGETLKNLWRRLDISKVPDDHDWPTILFALGNIDNVIDDYRQEALSNYMRFLDARRQAIDSFRDHSANNGDIESSLTSMPHRNLAESSSSGSIDNYSRLPHSHSVELNMEADDDITVFLGKNRYKLSKHEEVLTLKESGAERAYTLKPGRNMIGRSSECDVHLDNRQTDISRQHLIVEYTSGPSVNLMDVSSRGTYVRNGAFRDSQNITASDQL